MTKLDTRVLDAIAKGLDKNSDQVLASVAFQVEAEAKVRAPVDTGALKNSIHTEKKKVGLYWVADAVNYGIYNELGTSRMSAHPFMKPAVEKVQQYLADLYRKLFP